MIKKVAYCYYVHISNVRELIEELKNPMRINWLIKVLTANEETCKKVLNGMQVYELYTLNPVIVKYNIQDNSVSLIECLDWDTSNEPTVGDSYCFKIDGTIKKINGGTKVYHNKWQFVSKNYNGFDIEKAKRRTEEWNSIEGIKGLKSRIGSKKFWHELLIANDIEI